MKTRRILEEHFRRARLDIGFRTHMIESARFNRSLNGWAALVFALLAAGQIIYEILRGAAWSISTPIFCAVGCAFSVLAFNKSGERLAMLGSMGDLPNHSPDPTPAPGTPPAGAGGAPSVASDH
jgi:hypothetical protein